MGMGITCRTIHLYPVKVSGVLRMCEDAVTEGGWEAAGAQA